MAKATSLLEERAWSCNVMMYPRNNSRYASIIARNDKVKSRFKDILVAACRTPCDVASHSESSPLSLQYEVNPKEKLSTTFIFNIIKPLSLITDGALMIVDYEHGICDKVEAEMRKALSDKISVVLLINNVDSCFYFEGEKVYQILFNIVKNVNSIIKEFKDADEVCPGKGTVIFTFGLSDSAFNLSKFATDGSVPEKLWGDNYYDPRYSKWYSKKTKSASCKRGFVHFCYEPIKEILRHASDNEIGKLCCLAEKLGIDVNCQEKSDGMTLMKSIMQKWLPADSLLAEMMISHLPSPVTAQQCRFSILYTGDESDKYAQAISCNPDGPLMLYVSNYEDKSSVLGRVYSGNVSTWMTVRVIRPAYRSGGKEHTCCVKLWDENKTGYVEKVSSGSLVVLESVCKF
ncbi:elongation factor 2-like [Papaver somniferum]|uniref:elongation factor 2-like n=1 Tax=Papaver somniferum TaxID=3469 RepID=UPI000E6FF353|nr:elongation factor 2-like [Papaver somniferum]